MILSLKDKKERDRLLWLCAKVAERWAAGSSGDIDDAVQMAHWLRLEIVRRHAYEFGRTGFGVVEALHRPCSSWIKEASASETILQSDGEASTLTDFGERLAGIFPALELEAGRSDLVVECAVVASSWDSAAMAEKCTSLWERAKSYWTDLGLSHWPVARIDDLLALPLSFWIAGAQDDPVLRYDPSAKRLVPERWVLELTSQDLAVESLTHRDLTSADLTRQGGS